MTLHTSETKVMMKAARNAPSVRLAGRALIKGAWGVEAK